MKRFHEVGHIRQVTQTVTTNVADVGRVRPGRLNCISFRGLILQSFLCQVMMSSMVSKIRF